MRMTADREIANAISDGLNCIAELLAALSAVEHPDSTRASLANPEWPKTLQAMEDAFDTAMGKELITSLMIKPEDVVRIRRTRALVFTWLEHGQVSKELRALAEATLSSFGVPINNAEKEVS